MAISIKDVYLETIQKGITAADLIKDATAKANAYAALAAAMVPLIEKERTTTEEAKGKEPLKKGSTKGRNNKKAVQSEAPTPVATDTPLSAEPMDLENGETVILEEASQEAPAPTEKEEWSQEAPAPTEKEEPVQIMEVEEEPAAGDDLATEFEGCDEETLNRLRQDPALLEDLRWHIQLVAENGEEVLNQYVPIWSNNQYTTLDDITLDNVQSFVTYMKACIEG